MNEGDEQRFKDKIVFYLTAITMILLGAIIVVLGVGIVKWLIEAFW